MIADLKTKLESDTTLATLLLAGTGNTKIYLEQPPTRAGETTPYIVLSYSSDGTRDDVLEESIIETNVTSDKPELARQIIERVKELLDLYNGVSVPSSYFKIFFCQMVGGQGTYREEDDLFHAVRLFLFKYKRLNGK
jgi:hypothetical protein